MNRTGFAARGLAGTIIALSLMGAAAAAQDSTTHSAQIEGSRPGDKDAARVGHRRSLIAFGMTVLHFLLFSLLHFSLLQCC